MVPENSPGISRVPGYSGAGPVSNRFRLRDCHPLWTRFPTRSAIYCHSFVRSYNPGHALRHGRFGLFRVRSPLLTESLFTFSSCDYLDVSVHHVRPRFACVPVEPARVAPFGYLRIYAHLPLPATFRSLSRPSSPPRAKASSVCPYLLSFYCFVFNLTSYCYFV